MPQNTQNVRTDGSTEPRVPIRPTQPHNVPSFWRLFGLFKRQTRPVSYDFGYDENRDALSSYKELDRLSSLAADRRRRYDIFDEMDRFGLVSAILNVYAEESTQPDYDKGVRVWIESKAKHMVSAGNSALVNCMVEDRVFPITRRMCKYGDAFQRLLYASGKGVLGWRYASQHQMTRVEDKYGRLVGCKEHGAKFRKALHPDGTDTSFPWDYIHFRLLGKNEEDGYGTGICEQIFREWRYMTLTEDSMLMYRLRRVPDRNVVLVDVGSLEDHEAMRYVNQWRKRLRKHELVDPASQVYKKQFNPLTPMEDLFYPIRADSNTRIETMQGGGNIGEIYDLEHFRDAFFGAAAAPKAYFGFEGEIDAKATLQQQDIRFARGAKRVQRGTIYGMRQLLDVHFTLLATPENSNKFDPTQANNEYLVMMSPISYLDEFERLEMVRMRYEIVQTMAGLKNDLQLDARMWAIFILLQFGKLPEEMVMRLVQQTSPKPVEAKGFGAAFDALPRETRDQILDNANESARGMAPLSPDEKGWIELCLEASPRLRQHVRNFQALADDERQIMAAQQTDPSLLPIEMGGNGDNYMLSDDYNEDPATKELVEDLRVMRAAQGVVLNATVAIQLDEGQKEPTEEQVAKALEEAMAEADEMIAKRKEANGKRSKGSSESTSKGAGLAGTAASGRAYEARTTGDLRR